MNDDMTMRGPFEIELKVHITDEDGRQGKVTYSLPLAEFPTEEKIRSALDEAAKAVEDQGFRLMTKPEFINTLMSEKFGTTENFAVPGGPDWD